MVRERDELLVGDFVDDELLKFENSVFEEDVVAAHWIQLRGEHGCGFRGNLIWLGNMTFQGHLRF